VQPQICHPERIYPIESLDESEDDFRNLILGRLLFLFTDVICLFADDLGGVNSVCELLRTWSKLGSASTLAPSVRPRVIIVIGHPTRSSTETLLDREDILFQLSASGAAFFTVFGDLEILYLPQETLSMEALYMGLGSELANQLRHAKATRERNQVLFSAEHLNAFFESALLHIPRLHQPFDFIKWSRKSQPVDGAFAYHISRFATASHQARLLYPNTAKHIASAILLDAYPDNMHSA
jgi:hypothetical protein